MRLHMSRERLSVPTPPPPPPPRPPAPPPASSHPHAATPSANAAITSIATTISAPSAPSGLRRANRPTARSVGASGCAGPLSSAGFARASPNGGDGRGATEAPSDSVSDPGIEDGIERVDGQVDQDDRRDDDQVHALDHGVIALADRVEEEAAHAGQAEDRLEIGRAHV